MIVFDHESCFFLKDADKELEVYVNKFYVLKDITKSDSLSVLKNVALKRHYWDFLYILSFKECLMCVFKVANINFLCACLAYLVKYSVFISLMKRIRYDTIYKTEHNKQNTNSKRPMVRIAHLSNKCHYSG